MWEIYLRRLWRCSKFVSKSRTVYDDMLLWRSIAKKYSQPHEVNFSSAHFEKKSNLNKAKFFHVLTQFFHQPISFPVQLLLKWSQSYFQKQISILEDYTGTYLAMDFLIDGQLSSHFFFWQVDSMRRELGTQITPRGGFFGP